MGVISDQSDLGIPKMTPRVLAVEIVLRNQKCPVLYVLQEPRGKGLNTQAQL